MSVGSHTSSDELNGFEQLLKSGGILTGGEDLHKFFNRSYSEIQPLFNNYIHDIGNFLKPVPGEQSNRSLFLPFILMSFSVALYTLQETSGNNKVKTNADALRRYIDHTLVGELSPYILCLFQWDFKRRVWKHHHDEYKISYLKKVVDELNHELTGNKEEVVKKYISLLLDFIIEKFERHLLHIDNMPFDEEQKSKAHDLLWQIKKISNRGKISEIIDDDAEASFFESYKPVAQNYLEGLILPTRQFEYLIYSFAEAQNDYKKFIETILHSVQISEFNYLTQLRTSLQDEDIPKFIKILGSLFSTVPHNLVKNTTEAYYHIFIHLVLKLTGFTIVSEAETSQGRIDMVIEFQDLVYIIEFKMSDSFHALEQILQRQYFKPYLALSKRKLLLGLSFNKAERNINEKYNLKEVG